MSPATGTFEHGEETLVFRASGGSAGKEPGYPRADAAAAQVWRLCHRQSRLRSAGPQGPKQPSAGLIQGETEVTGLMRGTRSPQFFHPCRRSGGRDLFHPRSELACKAFRFGARRPFTSTLTAHSFREGGRRVARPSATFKQHLSYALTWFGLAITLFGVFAAFAWQRR